jgi:glycosyltransferase involved in cell wall biosynthesis
VLSERIIALIDSPAAADAFVRHNLDLVSREADSSLNVSKVKQLVRRVSRTTGPPPLFSVLVPTYNQADFLREALDSLLAQSLPDWEALVVNDGSIDHTWQVMEEYASRDRRIRIFHKENGGVASALNRGIREARGQWVCWLSSDDIFEPDKLRIHHEALLADPSIRFMHTNFSLFYEESRTLVRDSLRTDLVIPPRELQLLYFLRFNYINGISIAIRRDVFDEVGLFDEALRCGQDYDMWLRITARFPSAFIDRHTCVTRVHPGQGTHQFVEAGIFDSCCAAVGFLNAHPFPDIFPLLDLTDPAQAMRAVEQTLCVLADEHAYVNMAGFGPLLADRLLEWSSWAASQAFRSQIAALVGRVAELVANAGSPASVRKLFAYLRQVGEPVRFEPRDFSWLLESHLGEMRNEGRTREAEAMEKYLSRNADQMGRGKVLSAGVSRRLSILLVLHNFPPHNHAGVEIYSYLMARELQRQGHEVSVFYPYLEPGAETTLLTEEFDGIRTYRLRTPGPQDFGASLTDPVIEEMFARFTALHRFDLVHFHHTQLLLPITLIELARMQGLKTVLTLHDFWYICLRTHLFMEDGTVCSGPDSVGKCAACWRTPAETMERFLSTRARLVERIMAGVDLLTAPSRFVAGLYGAYGCGREITVTPLGVRRCAAGMGRARPGVTFGYLGTIHPLKNVFGLVEAFQQTAGTSARLLIYGNGDPAHIDRLRSVIDDDRVEYRGGYGAADICGILNSVDMAVIPSFIESYCMTVREALNAGIPVIAAKVGGIPEAVTDRVNGLLFDPHDLEQLTRLLQSVIDTPEIIGQMRGNVAPLKTIEDDAAEWTGRYLHLCRSGEAYQDGIFGIMCAK